MKPLCNRFLAARLMLAALAFSAMRAAHAAFDDLTKPSEAAQRAVATTNGERVAMTGKGAGSDGSKYPPENIFDDDLATFTCAQKAPTAASPIELGYDFGAPVKVDCYRLFAHSTAGNGGWPKTWTLEGSGDGVKWTVLDSRKDVALSRGAWHTFFFKNSAAYRRYRLKTTESASTRRFDLGEMELGCADVNAAAPGMRGKTLRLATYNIHHGERTSPPPPLAMWNTPRRSPTAAASTAMRSYRARSRFR